MDALNDIIDLLKAHFFTPGGLEVAGPVVLLAAILLDWVVGGMTWIYKVIPHPVAMIGAIIGRLDRKLNREGRSEGARKIRGALTSLFVISLAIGIGYAVQRGLERLPHGWLAEVVIVAVLLAQRSLFDHVGAVAKGLKQNGLKGGREAIRHIVSRDPMSLDDHGVARSAIESLSENFSDGVVAPAFWYLIAGLPGILGYKAINTLDSMIGYKTDRHRAFGMVAARIDDAANWIPARISGFIMVVAAVFSPGASPAKAFRVMIRDARKHKSPNAGWPEAAMAGALDFAIGGPRKYPGGITVGTWIGDGRARLGHQDIRRAQMLFAVSCGVMWLLVAGATLLYQG